MLSLYFGAAKLDTTFVMHTLGINISTCLKLPVNTLAALDSYFRCQEFGKKSVHTASLIDAFAKLTFWLYVLYMLLSLYLNLHGSQKDIHIHTHTQTLVNYGMAFSKF